MPVQPATVSLPAFTVAGLQVRTTNAQEMSGSGGRIGPLWGRFMSDGGQIPGALDRETIFAVYTGYECDENGPYDLVLGRSVDPDKPAAEGFVLLSIPAAKYVIFPVKGGAPSDIMEAWRAVYAHFAQNPSPKRAYTCDFERHGQDGTKIYIAVAT